MRKHDLTNILTFLNFTIFDIFTILTISDNFWKTQQFLTILTIDNNFHNSDNCFCYFDNWKDNDLWDIYPNLSTFDNSDTCQCDMGHVTCDMDNIRNSWVGYLTTPHKGCAPLQPPQPRRGHHHPLQPLRGHHHCFQHHGKPHSPLLPPSPKVDLNKFNHKSLNLLLIWF